MMSDKYILVAAQPSSNTHAQQERVRLIDALEAAKVFELFPIWSVYSGPADDMTFEGEIPAEEMAFELGCLPVDIEVRCCAGVGRGT